MHNPLRFLLASLLVPAVVLLGETASLAQYYPPAAPPPGYGPPPGQPMPGYAPTPYRPMPVNYPGYHEHDGFYMRLVGGAGYLNTTASYAGQSTTISGFAGSFAAAFGGTIAPNLIIYGEIAGMSARNPEVSSGGQSWTAHGTTLSMLTFGPGLAYYLQPMNVYFSGTVGFGYFNSSRNDDDYYGDEDDGENSDLGFGFSTMVGKEWWLTADWGIGVAGQFQLATAKYYDERLTGYGFALMFSATYN